MDLVPNLPLDVVRECLIRVSYNQLPKIASTCKAWKTEIELPAFFLLRRAAGYAQKLVVIAQARDDPERRIGVSKSCHSVYRLSVLDPCSGNWDELPPVPGLPHGLPYFCQIRAVGSELVVMGGLEPGTWEVSRSVHVFNFLSGCWRRGVDIPGVRRLLFGCASDHHRVVYVAGGHDSDKNALRSAMAYDVEKDNWTQLPDMRRERDECKGIFQRGKFHIIGGYCTAMQGHFERSAEEFDVMTWRWNSVEEEFLEAGTCPRTCSAGDEMDVYMCCGADVVTRKGAMWKMVAKLPSELGNTACVVTWRGKLLAIGSSKLGEPHRAYVLDLEKAEWTEMQTPEKFSGHVQSGCYIEI
ncbi:hypothetical protein SLEP1_g21545 [Rubroshorea leprosula]|uniref:F-box domain-containing protein n=1 Tax=Rubroshorea leprosula TaxID=152421 RepID=A0AAV5JGU6_9ROSI|nr:hypothetical protein SLEP1_g21545 [Rubroshorea leprosula]